VSVLQLAPPLDPVVSLGTDTSDPTLAPNAQTILPHQVRLFRKGALRNGYKLLRVKTRSKAPLAAGRRLAAILGVAGTPISPGRRGNHDRYR
jgi:hypothetical protein